MNLDDLNNDQQAALPRILKFFRLKGLKLWSTGYEVIEYSKFGMRKGRGKTDEKKTSEVPGMLSAVLSCFFESITSKRMTVFALFGLKLAPKTWAQFANGLAASQISTVCVNHCEVTDKEFETLFQALGMMAKLNVLDLAHNKITDGYLVARVISRQGERRDVSKWEGGLRGSVASIPEGLSELYLSDNLLADIGWEKIMSSLISDNWLRLIDCKRNNISNRSLKQTLKVMKENKSLLVVDLRFNINFERGFLKVMEIIDRNFDSIEKGTETCNHFTQLFELIVNELEFPSVCQVRFVRNAVKKLKIKSPLENLDRKLNSVAGRYTSVELIKEKPKKKGWSVMRNVN
jgi:hypothetical protein